MTVSTRALRAFAADLVKVVTDGAVNVPPEYELDALELALRAQLDAFNLRAAELGHGDRELRLARSGDAVTDLVGAGRVSSSIASGVQIAGQEGHTPPVAVAKIGERR